MSGLTQDTPQNNATRALYMSMVRNAINAENMMNRGEPDNTIQSFGALYGMREQMDHQVGFGGAKMFPHKQGGDYQTNLNNLKGVFNFMGEMKKSYDKSHLSNFFGLGKENEGIHIDINSHKNEPVGGEMYVSDSETETSSDEKQKKPKKGKKKGGMVLSEEAKKYHNSRNVGGKKKGGIAVTGSDLSGADIINSQPLPNQGPDVGSKASLGDKTPNTNAGIGVQSWTEYPNKSLSKEDIVEATATTRDLQNGMPVANGFTTEQLTDNVMKLAKGKRNYTEKSIGGMIKKGGFWQMLAPIAMSFLPKITEAIGLGKNGGSKEQIAEHLEAGLKSCGGKKEGGFWQILAPLAMSILPSVGKAIGLGKEGGAAVASPDIDEGKRAPINAGILQSTQIDGFQDPRTLGQGSGPGVMNTGGQKKEKKKRNRKPMSDEQKKAFIAKMKEAKMKKRVQK